MLIRVEHEKSFKTWGQALQNVVPDLDSKGLTFRWYSCKNFMKKVDFEKKQQMKKQQMTKRHEKFPRGQRVKICKKTKQKKTDSVKKMFLSFQMRI